MTVFDLIVITELRQEYQTFLHPKTLQNLRKLCDCRMPDGTDTYRKSNIVPGRRLCRFCGRIPSERNEPV